MHRFIAIGVGILSIVVTTGAVFAADLRARPITKAPAPAQVAATYDWSGGYIGVNGGAGWSRKCWDLVRNIFFAPVVPAASEGCHTATGAVAGGQLGYRLQSGSWVFGVEGQGDWANLSGSNGPNLAAGGVGSNRSRIDAFGLVTGQVGYAWGNVLFYLKGGAIVVSDRYEGFVTATGFVAETSSERRWGGAIGAGLEFGVTPNIVLGLDYVHGFLGARDNDFHFVNSGVFSRAARIQQDIDIVTARASYKFGGPIVAKY